MRKNVLYLMLWFCSLCVSCSTENNDNENVDYVSYNRNIVEYLQNKYDVTAEVEFVPEFKRKLNKQEVESFEDYFKFLGVLKKNPINMIQAKSLSSTRAESTHFSYELVYNGDRIYVHVYYDHDNNGHLASPPNIVAGMCGSSDGECFGGHYPTFETTYEIYCWDSSIRPSNTRIDVDRIRADYILKHYNIVNGVRSNTYYAITKTKLCSWGYINVMNGSGFFQLEYAGEGSWMRTIIDEDLKKEIEP